MQGAIHCDSQDTGKRSLIRHTGGKELTEPLAQSANGKGTVGLERAQG